MPVKKDASREKEQPQAAPPREPKTARKKATPPREPKTARKKAAPPREPKTTRKKATPPRGKNGQFLKIGKRGKK